VTRGLNRKSGLVKQDVALKDKVNLEHKQIKDLVIYIISIKPFFSHTSNVISLQLCTPKVVGV
jgi:hypothetical protein